MKFNKQNFQNDFFFFLKKKSDFIKWEVDITNKYQKLKKFWT